ncbi:hypothetical protein P8C59_005664 [Phyllachora maydis]|uniref:Uncharacterized protein n=1 Tax=Phyllachora maydis TaxID=1825666 RepID=A0AAD9I4R3_9PEZI|nr:hypothetical protein P8C59_005664 [Phyllachora maydis]
MVMPDALPLLWRVLAADAARGAVHLEVRLPVVDGLLARVWVRQTDEAMAAGVGAWRVGQWRVGQWRALWEVLVAPEVMAVRAALGRVAESVGMGAWWRARERQGQGEGVYTWPTVSVPVAGGDVRPGGPYRQEERAEEEAYMILGGEAESDEMEVDTDREQQRRDGTTTPRPTRTTVRRAQGRRAQRRRLDGPAAGNPPPPPPPPPHRGDRPSRRGDGSERDTLF